ncbi:hypothetical protein LVY72_02935 [Arthrobacter sp. I2-34]|uniref:RNase H type-1 domain-containing protein n=1 Tax=Arthrobacter hankyongi TaxID=2904801 RepID=A0ABS9L2H8_9MICC|nr:RNase H family protein [Arthrobacter hankyongi]MCG2620866.1 hypothetical protein [Arthrobacter hankyongi]
MSFPVPVPPVRRFISAADEVAGRNGVSIRIDHRRGHYFWAVARNLGPAVVALRSGCLAEAEVTARPNVVLQQVQAAVLELSGHGVIEIFCDDENEAQRLRDFGLAVSRHYPPAPAIAAMEELVAARLESLYTNLEIATDASRGNLTRWVGHGWVLDFGGTIAPVLGCKAIEGGSVLEGELRAIRLALAAARATYAGALDGRSAVIVRSDNQDAVRMLAHPGFEPASANLRCISEAKRILDFVRHGHVQFRWVKGHAGDPLNTAADRLAVLARRTKDAHLPPEVAAALRESVTADARNALRRSGVALAA